MTVVLGVDPSLTCSGVATVRWNPGADFPGPVWETWRARAVRPDVDSIEGRRRRIRVMLREILALVPAVVTLSVVEGPSFGSRTGMSLADERAGLRWMLIDQLLARGPVVVVSPSTREMLAVGRPIPRGTSTKARKATVLESVRAMVPDANVPNHDVADAVALAVAGARHFGMPCPTYTAAQVSAHANVAWPVGRVAA